MVQKRRRQRGVKNSLKVNIPLHPSPLAAPSSPLGQPIYTTAQVATALQLSSKTILRAIGKGLLEARKVGKLYLIPQDAVRRYWEGLPLATAAPKTVGRPKKMPLKGAGVER